ncbi:coiled-coil domain-containing protein 15 [Anser cygnoides]|uniref:coiled-coil domain-containing protein 15 n=1 Tax=Anser cygnoides TaxID=8845 RepID=UPI0034D2B5B3
MPPSCRERPAGAPRRVLAARSPRVAPAGAWVESGPPGPRHGLAFASAFRVEEELKEQQREKAASLRRFQGEVKQRVNQQVRMRRKQQLQKSCEAAEKETCLAMRYSDSVLHLTPKKNTCVFRSHPAPVICSPSARTILAQWQGQGVPSEPFQQQATKLSKTMRQVRRRLASCQTVPEGTGPPELPGGTWSLNRRHEEPVPHATVPTEDESEERLVGHHDLPAELQDQATAPHQAEQEDGFYIKVEFEKFQEDLWLPLVLCWGGRAVGASHQTEASNKMEKKKFFIRGMNWHPSPLPQGRQLVGMVRNTSLRGSIYVPAPGNPAKFCDGSVKDLSLPKSPQRLNPTCQAPLVLWAGIDQEETKKQRQNEYLRCKRLFMNVEREQVKEQRRQKEQQKRIAKIKSKKENQRQVEEQKMQEMAEQQEPCLGESVCEILAHLELEERRLKKIKEKQQRNKEYVRYVEALRAQVKEKMKLYNIELPPLCSCSSDFWESHPDTCANNCVFYKNHKAYSHALQSVVLSCDPTDGRIKLPIRDLAALCTHPVKHQ